MDVKKIYTGHEVASHTLHHPNLTKLNENDIVYEVEQDRKNLSNLVGYDVCGFAYPCGGTNYDMRVANAIQNRTNIKYARTIECSYSFDLPSNMYTIHPTVYHIEYDKMMELAKAFIEEETDEKRLFYVGGHSYELDAWDMWDKFEEFLKYIEIYDNQIVDSFYIYKIIGHICVVFSYA